MYLQDKNKGDCVLLAIILFIIVLVLVIVQPRGLSIGYSAAGGAIIALLLGLVSIANVIEVVDIVWDATLTFVALILISMVLDRIGFFEWAALSMSHLAKDSGYKLFIWIGLLGAVVAMFFANDGAALILTPLVYEQTRILKLSPKATLAFIMTSGFIADTTSVPLVISNLVNIVSADYFHLGFLSYMVHMVPVDLVALSASLVALFIYYHKHIPVHIDTSALPDPKSRIKDVRVFRLAWIILPLLLSGYFLSQFLHWPVSIFTMAAAAVLLAGAAQSPYISSLKLIKEAPWKIVVFSIGMYIVVFGLRNQGLTAILGHQFHQLSVGGTLTAAVGTGFIAALLSSVMNNMPTVLIDALAIHHAHLSSVMTHLMAYANVIGSDLGPKLTPIGSLATLLWLHVLEQRQVRISYLYYMKVGFLLTIPVLLTTLVALAIWIGVIGA
ncbi:arsenic transporter [Sulfobacillus thermosulfidooxidans]|nr:arsenic transporter [Sulfobacillus thermosulfidooxidans]OLZ11719.1 arsenic transporter [Sulfobacillus thermosulfidooxidans]OLZ18682.1 arsenic transporter [Sulfobacillus thermosulfidooxidans]OLZ20239.1 arsenic transporter [Sulfobacillus thermosulfidooxidans]